MQDFSEEVKKGVNHNLGKKFYRETSDYPEDIEDEEDFRKLPTSSKEEFVDEDGLMFGKEFLDEAQAFNYTSGTTSHPTMVLISEEDMEAEKEKVRKQAEIAAGKRNYVVISETIARRGMLRALDEMDVLCGYTSPYNPGFSVRAIETLEIDTLWSTPSLALKIGDLASEKGSIEFVDTLILTGEPLSDLSRKKLKEYYSDPEIYLKYGSIETGTRAYQCKHLKGTDSYHVYPDKFFYEILEFDGDKNLEEDYGELVTTKIWEKSFSPQIRYRSGDKAIWRDSDCGCGAELTVEITGKTVFDSFKMQGITLYRERFERSLDSVADLIDTGYQIHIRDREREGELQPELEVHLKTTESLNKELMDEEDIAESIASNFQITDKDSYKDMSGKGIFSELKVVLKDSVIEDAKTEPIVDHRS